MPTKKTIYTQTAIIDVHTFSADEVRHALCQTFKHPNRGAELHFQLVGELSAWSGMPFDDGRLPQKVSAVQLTYRKPPVGAKRNAKPISKRRRPT